MIISRCEDCNHRHICKHKDEYDKVIRDITVKVPDPFTMVLNCKHYYSTMTYLSSTGTDSNYASSNAINTVTSPYLPGSPEVTY